MLILGIESSCDETGVALYDTNLDGKNGILADALNSQIKLHAEYGGVVPELASRDHIKFISPLVQQVFADSKKNLNDVDLIAYTIGPGLAGALLVGSTYAESLGIALQKPVLPLHHLEGHLLSPLLSGDLSFPFIALLVSGGHTQIVRVNDVGNYTLLGESIDDAAGEAFDKTAKLLGLEYPGGAKLSKLADNFANKFAENKFKLPRPMLNSGDFNFSFSGLKTAVLNQVNKAKSKILDEQFKQQIAYEFQEAIVEVLCKKVTTAMRQENIQNLVIAGGVGANLRLRREFNDLATKKKFRVLYPPLEFCTDNGVMIAFAAALKFKRFGDTIFKKPGSFDVKPRCSLF